MNGIPVVIVGVLLSLCGCESSVESVSENRPLLGTTWALQYFPEVRGSRTVIGSQGMELEF